jgi:hypothetical protein
MLGLISLWSVTGSFLRCLPMRSASRGHRRVMETILAFLECTCWHCTGAHACACSILSRFTSGQPWTPKSFSGKKTSRDMSCAQSQLVLQCLAEQREACNSLPLCILACMLRGGGPHAWFAAPDGRLNACIMGIALRKMCRVDGVCGSWFSWVRKGCEVGRPMGIWLLRCFQIGRIAFKSPIHTIHTFLKMLRRSRLRGSLHKRSWNRSLVYKSHARTGVTRGRRWCSSSVGIGLCN